MTKAIIGGSGDRICSEGISRGLPRRTSIAAPHNPEHLRIFQPGDRVEDYIRKYLRQYGRS